MAGVVTQSGNLVWQKVKNALSVNISTNPAHQLAFLSGLKPWLAEQKRNPDLQFLPYSAEDIVTAGGYQPIAAGACTIYGVYGKGRRTSGTTAAFFQIFDQADNTASTTLIIAGTRLNLTGQSFSMLFPAGLIVATELTLAADTTVAGATESSAADACDGFVIVGA
jgi:hypothetical protein